MGLTELDIKRGRKQLQLFEQSKSKNVRTQRKVIKQGNSYMLSIPSKIVKELNLTVEDFLTVEFVGSQIVITPNNSK